jgi:aspartate/glutamate racemase
MNLKSISKSVALVSSTRAVFGPMEAAFREVFPEAQILHILDETLIEDFRREGGLSTHSRQKALRMALTAEEAGVDGILVTCSTLSPSVDDLRPFLKIPIIKIDEPVIEEVVQKADTVGLLATAETVLKSVEPLVMKKALDFRRKVSISRFV